MFKEWNKLSAVDLKTWGLSQDIIDLACAESGITTREIARVTVQYQGIYQVITEIGDMLAEVAGKMIYQASDTNEFPVVGDWVLLAPDFQADDRVIIREILPRTTALARVAAGLEYHSQVIAANIDIVFICMSLNNDFNLSRCERYLVMVWESGAKPVIVLTKADLCADIEDRINQIQGIAWGVDIAMTNMYDEDGYAEIDNFITPGKTIALVGSSGVGKSTIINHYLSKSKISTSDIRNDDKGRHTTTNRHMHLLPGGGIIIDTPGMRELGLESGSLDNSFNDIESLAEACYFKDCQHDNEPKCAVKEAIKAGELDIRRFNNYQKLKREMLFNERKATMNEKLIEKQKMVDMMGSLNAYKQIRQQSRKK